MEQEEVTNELLEIIVLYVVIRYLKELGYNKEYIENFKKTMKHKIKSRYAS